MSWFEYDVAAAIQADIAPASLIPILQDLPLLILLVEHHRAGVLGLVELADVGVDAELAEHPLHAEGARLVGHDRHDPFPIFLSRSSAASTRTKAIVVETSRSPVPSS